MENIKEASLVLYFMKGGVKESDKEGKGNIDIVGLRMARIVKVLLAEENTASANISIGLIEKNGFSVDWVISGQLACEKALSSYYDLIVLDAKTSKIDGREVSQKIQEYLQNKRPPILLLSQGDLDQKDADAPSVHFDGVINKPFEPDVFMERIKSMVLQVTENSATQNHVDLLFDLEKIEVMLDEKSQKSLSIIGRVAKSIAELGYRNELDVVQRKVLNNEYVDALYQLKTLKMYLSHDIQRR